MSEVFGDDFPDVFSTVLNDAETRAVRAAEAAVRELAGVMLSQQHVREDLLRASLSKATVEGNVYANGGFTIVGYAEGVTVR